MVVGFPLAPDYPWSMPSLPGKLGSERQASALQIHHLSLPLLASGKSVSNHCEGGREGGGGGGGEETVERGWWGGQ